MERQSTNEQSRLTDDELIDLHIADMVQEQEATNRLVILGHAAARMIASQYHDGQASHLYSFTSTGAVSVKVFEEAHQQWLVTEDEKETSRLFYLTDYLAQRVQDGIEVGVPLEGWHTLWLRQPGEPL